MLGLKVMAQEMLENTHASLLCWQEDKICPKALRIQIQLAPHLVHQLTWDRFLSSHGGAGHNIPCDLHNEHINKWFKEVIRNMGANYTEIASTTVARAVTTITHMVESFDSQTELQER